MTEERLNEILKMVGYLLNDACIARRDGIGYNIVFEKDDKSKSFIRNYFYLATFEFDLPDMLLVCRIADTLLRDKDTPY